MSLKFFKHLDMVIFQVLDKKHGEVSDRTQAYGYIQERMALLKKAWVWSQAELSGFLLDKLGFLSYLLLAGCLAVLRDTQCYSKSQTGISSSDPSIDQKRQNKVGGSTLHFRFTDVPLCSCCITLTVICFPSSDSIFSWYFRIYGKSINMHGMNEYQYSDAYQFFFILTVHLSHLLIYLSEFFSAFVLAPLSSLWVFVLQCYPAVCTMATRLDFLLYIINYFHIFIAQAIPQSGRFSVFVSLVPFLSTYKLNRKTGRYIIRQKINYNYLDSKTD